MIYRTAENGVAEIDSGRSRFSVHTMPADEFPGAARSGQHEGCGGSAKARYGA